jgi:transcriptional regulator with XRE-family HTH domain
MASSDFRARPRKPASRFTEEHRLLVSRLVAIRKAAGISQEEIAERTGKDQSHISRCELLEREISAVELLKWCQALEIDFLTFAKQWIDDIHDTTK